jgi:hypothetical protein
MVMKKNDKYRKFRQALSSVPSTEFKDLLIQDKHGKLKKIKPLDVMYEGSSFGLILDMYHDLQELHSTYKKDTGHSISTLIAFLKAKGYDKQTIDLNALIEDLNHLLIIEADKEYSVYHKDANGYVVSSSVILSDDSILSDFEKPDDYNKGYWKIVDGKWVLDEQRMNELLGGIL